MVRDNNSTLGVLEEPDTSVFDDIFSLLTADNQDISLDRQRDTLNRLREGLSLVTADMSPSLAAQTASLTVPATDAVSGVGPDSIVSASPKIEGTIPLNDPRLPDNWYDLNGQIQLDPEFPLPAKAPYGCERHIDHGFMSLFLRMPDPSGWMYEVFVYLHVGPFLLEDRLKKAEQDKVPVEQSLYLLSFECRDPERFVWVMVRELMRRAKKSGIPYSTLIKLTNAFFFHAETLLLKLKARKEQ
jgi:hypothetical protein